MTAAAVNGVSRLSSVAFWDSRMIPLALSCWSRRAGVPLLWGDTCQPGTGGTPGVGWLCPAALDTPIHPGTRAPCQSLKPSAPALLVQHQGHTPALGQHPSLGFSVPRKVPADGPGCPALGWGWDGHNPGNPLPWSLNTGSPGWTSGAPCNRESVTRNLCLGNGTKPHVPHNRGVGGQLRSSAGAGSHQVDLNLGAVELFSACPCTQKGKEQTCLKSWQRLVFQRGLKLLEDKAWSSLGCLWCWHMLASRNKVLSCPQHLPF